jgi:16S rRNA (uracil1498-N3)-methyltransferase
MQLFYASEIYETYVVLSEDESRHCIKVLRKSSGDNVEVIDGKGHLFEGVLEIENKNKPAKVYIRSKTFYEEKTFKSGFHLAIAPTKNADRMEWLLEKAIEMGLGSITFINCEHNERSNLRKDRLEKIAISALKQSLQHWLPPITMGISFKEYLEKIPVNAKAYIAHCQEGNKIEFGSEPIINPCYMLIGPEGDFSTAEISLAMDKDLEAVSLGKSRLRTETAGLYACGVYRQLASGGQ